MADTPAVHKYAEGGSCAEPEKHAAAAKDLYSLLSSSELCRVEKAQFGTVLSVQKS